MGQMMKAIEGFFAGDEFVAAGEILDSSHSLVRNHPEFFQPLVARFDVEAATAAPGEKRAASVKPSAAKAK